MSSCFALPFHLFCIRPNAINTVFFIMSKTTKRKHVMKEILWDDFELPKENQSVVKVVSSKGNNLHEVESHTGEIYLASMPTKFRKNIWVKRGDYILVEPILEGDKVKAEIVRIMNKDSIKFFKENNVWPQEFEDKKVESVCDKNSDDSNSDDDLFVNTNRVNVNNYSSSDTESSSDDNT